MGTARHVRRHRPRQEISVCLKYLIFAVNFIFWICGVTCTVLGVYLYAKDFRAVLEAIDFFLNPSILLIVSGCIMFLIAFLGCTGALRENTCMLKVFSLCLFFAYVSLVVLAFVVFILFYSDTKTGVSIQTLLQTAVTKYHNNENMREMMDYLQSNLGCCGASSQGYKDWNNNQLYNCSSANLTPEQCGVPPSCCKSTNKSIPQESLPVPPTAVSPIQDAAAQLIQSSYVDGSMNPRCGFHTQDKAVTELQNILYTDGCLQLLQRAFEGNAVIIGAVIGAILVPVCLSVTLSNVLARQIEHQRYLLAKEARKERRRRRRQKSQYRNELVPSTMTIGADAKLRVARHAMEISGNNKVPPAVVKEPPAIWFVENEFPLLNPSFGHNDFNKTAPPPEIFSNSRPCGDAFRELPPAPAEERIARNRRKPKSSKTRGHQRTTSAAPHGRSRNSRPRRHQYPNSRPVWSDDDDPMATYTGPIIVELSSTTHDLPPPQYRQHDDSPSGSFKERERNHAKNL